MNPKKLLIRSLSGLIYIGIIIGCIFWGVIPFTCMAAVFAVIAVIEFDKIIACGNKISIPAVVVDVCGAICLSFGWMLYPLLIWLLVFLIRFIIELYHKSESPISNLAHSVMSQIYVAMPLGLMAFLGYGWSLNIVLAIFMMIWINDTGAFLVGSIIGRHRLFERISPKKSWEGFFGGLVFNLVAASLFYIYGGGTFSFDGFTALQSRYSLMAAWLGLGIVVTMFSTWGDLVESMIKRNLHIKDSGNIIPGHGGILDRIDSLLLVMPASLLYLIFIGLL